ncbi:MAG: Protein-L-isoaspartate O-methyltransferase [Parcubacteria group bacterium GW2011_GWA1_Parcubacteria_45_10]|nr:MAG: Protein-L-isoaspartate O-methyltransferase [Parcubacteria group bacterium GW2011_GWA1_Parcubacteria_45_10]
MKTPLIISAFEKIDRKDFAPKEFELEAYEDYPLPIGFEQTISQPWTVAFMMELLQPQSGEKILDIGSGSGYTTALLAYCVSQQRISNSQFSISPAAPDLANRDNEMLKNSNPQKSGKVFAVEIVPELCELGRKNCEKYGSTPLTTGGFVSKGRAEFVCQDGNLGYEKGAPYDKILVSAALNKKEIPQAWKEQLEIGGRIVCPIGNSVWVFDKISKDSWQSKEHPGFAFVPLVS